MHVKMVLSNKMMQAIQNAQCELLPGIILIMLLIFVVEKLVQLKNENLF